MKRKQPRVAVITGASRGLGKALAITFAGRGLRVMVNYIQHRIEADSVVEKILRTGGTATAFRADVRNPEDLRKMFLQTVQRWGRIDILINNAGVVSDKKIATLSETDWDHVLSVNLTGTANAIRTASSFFAKQKSGHILNIASFAGIHGRRGQANYSASKAGIINLTKSAAMELGAYHVCVNTILPGILDIGMGNRLSNAQRNCIKKDLLLPHTPPIHQVTEFIYQVAHMEGVSGQLFNLDSRIVV